LNVVLPEIRMYEGRRLMTVRKKDDKTARSLGGNVFESFEVAVSLESVFSRRFELSVDVLRNLDGVRSHNAPDLSVIARINNLTWSMTSDFYVLLRGVLERNFGDPLIPIPETIPIEILQKPITGCEVGSDFKYATLSFRLLFNDVELDCQVNFTLILIGLLVPRIKSEAAASTMFGKAFTPFAKMQLHSARVSFDVFIDGQSELDLVCDSANLIDTREVFKKGAGLVQIGSGTKNLFSTILRPRESSNKRYQLMSEAHIMMRKDEVPVVTLVLMHSRVLLFYDWLNDAKSFVMLCTDFIPKCEFLPCFRDSDLYLLENPSVSNSFAIVVNTSAVLNVSDPGGVMTTNLEIQNMNIGWCCMQNEEATLNQCSNEFSIGVSMAMDSTPVHESHKKKGLPTLAQKRHTVEVGDWKQSMLKVADFLVRPQLVLAFVRRVHCTSGAAILRYTSPA
uniref:BPI2 domain-containing protein n=1 Tax=Heligmosomoides polygyrus TaxID=6339 RepID=A0A183GJA7_HELPZ